MSKFFKQTEDIEDERRNVKLGYTLNIMCYALVRSFSKADHATSYVFLSLSSQYNVVIYLTRNPQIYFVLHGSSSQGILTSFLVLGSSCIGPQMESSHPSLCLGPHVLVLNMESSPPSLCLGPHVLVLIWNPHLLPCAWVLMYWSL